jgi:uncharacterized membrane protein YvlD (DUF360 family)
VTGASRRPAPGRNPHGIAFWRAFYRDQARLIWEWRSTRLALIRRALLSTVASALALEIVATLSPNLTLGGPATLAIAAVVLAALNAIARPILLLALSPFPVIVLQVAGLGVELLIVLAIGRFVPGAGVNGLAAAVFDALVLSALHAVFAEILRASDDDSYYGTQVRRLAARAFGRPRILEPGLLMVQLDGLSMPLLEAQFRSGRMPTLAKLVGSGEFKVDAWHPLLPPVTPVSQAGFLHGNNDDMPGFRWFEKSTKTLIIASTPDGAREIVHARSDGRGLLADGGASIGNLVTGDAQRSYLTMATIDEELPSDDDPRRLRGLFVSQVNYLRLLVLSVGELLKELYQRERQRGRGVVPRIDRNLHYAFERALTNVTLRNLTTALVIEEMFAGAPSIFVDYTGYDAVAHHAGPERTEAIDTLDGLDRTVASLLRAGRETHRPYRVVVLSDHGQCLGVPFSQRYGEPLEAVARRLMGDTAVRSAPRRPHEHPTGHLILGELGRGKGPRSFIARRAKRRLAPAALPAEDDGLVVCPSGNLALLYLTCSTGRVMREEIDERYPDLIAGLLNHPGVAVVMVRTALEGPIVLGRGGRHDLVSGRVTGVDPLLPFGSLATRGLRRLDGFTNCGDLVVIGPYDEQREQVVSYEDLVGSHGGPGGWQARPFILHPVDLRIGDAPLVGAVAVHGVLRGWLDLLRARGGAGAAGVPGVAESPGATRPHEAGPDEAGRGAAGSGDAVRPEDRVRPPAPVDPSLPPVAARPVPSANERRPEPVAAED